MDAPLEVQGYSIDRHQVKNILFVRQKEGLVVVGCGNAVLWSFLLASEFEARKVDGP